MKKIIKERGQGKTTELIKISAETQYPIIALTMMDIVYIKEQSNKMGYKIPDPILLSDWRIKYHGSDIKAVLVDEGEMMLETLLGYPIYAISLTKPKEIKKRDIADFVRMNTDDFTIVD
jgi:hypothetical protein